MARLWMVLACSMLVGCGARTGALGFDDRDQDAATHDADDGGTSGSDAGSSCPPSEAVVGTSCTLDVMNVCNWDNGCGAFDTGWCEGGRWSVVKPGCVTSIDAGPSRDAASCAEGAPCTGAETCTLGCFRSCTCEAGKFACLEHPC